MSSSSTRDRRDWFGVQSAGVFYALLLIVGGFAIGTTLAGRANYLSLANAESVLQQASVVGFLAVFTTVVLITGNFDLSIASTVALTSVVAIRLGGHIDTPLLVLLCLAIGALIGAINALLVVVIRVNAFIATLGTLQIVRGIVYLAAGQISVLGEVGDLRAMTNTLIPLDLRLLGAACGLGLALWAVRSLRRGRGSAARGDRSLSLATLVAGLLVAGLSLLLVDATLRLYSSVYIMLSAGLVVWLILQFTVLGRKIYAVGSNAEAALLAGIQVRRYQAGAFIVNGVACAFAGLMIAGQFQAVDPTVYVGQEFVVITGAILGGTALFGGSGNVLKSIVGAIIVIALGNGLNFQNLSSSWQYVVQGAALVIAASIYTLEAYQGSRRHRRAPDPDPVSAPVRQEVGATLSDSTNRPPKQSSLMVEPRGASKS